MEEKKNIERVFQEKFKNFEALPPLDSWNAIEKRLQQRKKKKRVIPFWLQYGSIAAGLTLALFIYWNTTNNNPKVINENNENVVFEQNDTIENNNSIIIDKALKNKNEILSNEEIVVTNNKEIKNSNSQNNLVNPSTTNSVVVSSTTNKKNKVNSNEFQKINSTIYSEKETDKISVGKENNSNLASTTIDKSTNNAIKNNNVVESLEKNNTAKNTLSVIASNDKKQNNTVEDNTSLVNTSVDKSNNAVKSLDKNNTTKSNVIVMSNKDEKQDKIKQNTIINPSSPLEENNIIFDKKVLNNDNFGIANNAKTNKDSTIVATELIATVNPLEQLLKEKEAGKNADEKEKEVMSKWAVSSNASPIYFNSSNANASPIGKEFSSNKKEYTTNLSVGLGLAYTINDKVSIRTGINSLPFNYDTQNVYYTSSLNTVSDNSINISRNANSANLVLKGESVSKESLSSDVNNISETSIASLRQQLNFIEVPFEISYKVLDRKIDIEVVGGLSTLFLNQNDVFLVNSLGKEMNIGKANNVNNIHFSSNIGLGFKYNFWKSFNANVQPMFKYQLNTFSQNDGNFKPYLVGVYSGLSYSF